MNLTGFVLAAVSTVLFGLYMVPRKLSRLTDAEFTASMAMGVLPTTFLIALVAVRGVGDPVPREALALGLVCGVIWVFGILFYTLSVSQMGLALATPIKNTTAILGTVIGLVFFAEAQQTRVPEALIGSALVVACAIILGRTGERSGSRSFITPVGIAFALLAALFFASYTAPLKLAMKLGLDSYRLITLMGIGSAGGGTLMVAVRERGVGKWFRQPLNDHLWSALAGALWALATITMTEAIRIIGLAVTWPVVNLNTVVTVACGIVLFHEISVRKFWKTLTIGMLCAIVGAVLLGKAKM